jgi:hypothetical protein
VGLIGRVLSFVAKVRHSANVVDVEVKAGGMPLLTAEHFSAPGDDSAPLDGDYVILSDVAPMGRKVVVGYLDARNAPMAAKGEKRIYARGTSGVVGSVWLKADGSVTVANTLGSFALSADGTINLNGVTISPTGEVTVPASLTLAGHEIAAHTHPILSGSSAPGPTGPNT